MERLTSEKCGEFLIKYGESEYRSPCFGCESIGSCNPPEASCGFYKALVRLKHYEDLEEQGKLLKLPVAVGDTVYVLEKSQTGRFMIYQTIADSFYCAIWMLDGKFGKYIFPTYTEAEAALKEMSE